MRRSTYSRSHNASRAKVGISVLTAVLTALLAGQLAAAPSAAHASSIQGASR